MFSFWKRRHQARTPPERQPSQTDPARVTIIGCGDAFGTGGRLNTCFHVATKNSTFLIDCGATTLIGMERAGLAPNDVDTIVLSHLHGDHYAGLVWWIMHAQFVSARQRPLTIIGPADTQERYLATAELLYPGSTAYKPEFPIEFRTFSTDSMIETPAFGLQIYEVSHPSGSLSAALRFTVGDKVIAFSGDTEWVDALVTCARDADIFLCECYGLRGKAHYHLTWEVLAGKLDQITAKKVVLTHLGEEMLAFQSSIRHPRVVIADDGLVLGI